jgi:type I restriction enzyme R subunit
MRDALPSASFIGFTGTPLMAGEERTRDVFGDYVSVYDFKQSWEDGATVPLYYENRIPELQLTNEHLNEDMEQLLEDATLDEDQEEKLEREFAREYHLITRDDRLERIAEDIVSHFMERGDFGKAMVVSIDKATAVRMYDKVRLYWRLYLDSLNQALASATDEVEREQLQKKIAFMEETDMAVVVSQGQNEVADMRKKGLDILPHRQRMLREDLATKFKNPDDRFRLVFVCAMWMTGFDVPSCSTIYLDKPMRNHTLMQTIARANRVFEEKTNGMIVDYVGVFRDLQKALAIYGSGGTGTIGEGDMPVLDKDKLVETLRAALASADSFCRQFGVSLSDIQVTPQGFPRIRALDDAREALLVNDETKRQFLSHTRDVLRLFKAILPDVRANEYRGETAVLNIIAAKIRLLMPAPDISEVMEDVERLLDTSVSAEEYVIRDEGPIDLGQIDFEALQRRFAHGKKRTESERLRATIERKLGQMVAANRTRVDFKERFEDLIEKYNAGAANVETFFRELMDFYGELNEEDKRSIAEELSEEELVVFDLLTKPELKLTQNERDKVKTAARDLLIKLKAEKLVLDWRKRQQSRAAVLVAIEDVFDRVLPDPPFTADVYRQKCELVYQHVYDSYFGEGRSVYTQD